LTGALRVDRNSAFGQSSRSALYPKVSASWIAVSGRATGWVNTLRLRGAYGASGLQPPSNAALAYYVPVQSTVGGATVAAVSLGAVGNVDLKPERSVEIETGFDVGAFRDRVNLELTYYHKRTSDALVSRNLPPSLGTVGSRFENLGEVVNQGVELGINARVIEHAGLQWDLGVRAAVNRNRLISLGGVPPIRGFGFAHVEGYPLYGLWDLRLKSFADANGDGVIVPGEFAVTDTAEFAGSPVPTRSVSLTTSLSLWGDRIRVGGLVDYRGGHVNMNVGEVFRCSFFGMCEVANDPNAPLVEQAKTLAGGGAQGAWIEDASFLKVREAYASFSLPASWARTMGARNAMLTLTARNLGIHAPNWSSWDPETNIWSVDGPNSTHSAQSPPRTFLLRLQLGF
jgi:outer membrane receptor protein involved in Fe transport